MKTMMRALQVVVTVAILAVVWRMVGGLEANQSLMAAKSMWLIAAVLTLNVQTVLSAIRWRITAGQLGLHLPVGTAIIEYYLSQMINQVLPGGVLGDASRAMRSRAQRGLVAASQAVIFERIAGQIALFTVMTVAVVTTALIPGNLEWPSWAAPIILLIILGGCGTAIAFVLATKVANPMREKIGAMARMMGHALLGRRVILAQMTLSFATVLCNLAAFAFCARAVGVVLPPLIICALVPLILFTMLVPLTVMGWGLREGAAVAFLPLAGATASESLAASVAFGLTMLVASVPGLVVLWIR